MPNPIPMKTILSCIAALRLGAATVTSSLVILLLSSAPGAFAAAAPSKDAKPKEGAATSAPTDIQASLPAGYRLQEGDVVKIAFDSTTNLNTIVKLQLDGDITLPMVGAVKALGKTPIELRGELMKQYETLLKGEDITVSIVTAVTCVYVSGAVLRPGKISMERPLTLMDAIMEAGGFDNNRAKPSGVTVFRVENGKQQHFKVDMKRVLSGKNTEVFYLKPFDTIHIPERTFNF